MSAVSLTSHSVSRLSRVAETVLSSLLFPIGSRRLSNQERSRIHPTGTPSTGGHHCIWWIDYQVRVLREYISSSLLNPFVSVIDLEISQIPIILFGEILCAIGTGLLTTIGLTTPTVAWAAFLVLVGFGLGMGINAPHIAIQAVFPRYSPLCPFIFYISVLTHSSGSSENDVFVANGIFPNKRHTIIIIIIILTSPRRRDLLLPTRRVSTSPTKIPHTQYLTITARSQSQSAIPSS